jgi:TRAP-type C4-dicarboxylate transport system substrate-binding protein
MYSYVSSFGIGMNPEFYKGLPADLRKLVDDSVRGVEKEVGEGWDALDDIGKKLLVEGGAEPIKLSAAENKRFRQVGMEVTEAKLKELEGKGLPARAAFKQIQALSAKHAKTSRNFWQ